MKANFSFLEYSYNSKLGSPSALFKRLETLGWTLRSRHKKSGASIWNHNKSIMLIKDNPDITSVAKATGLGFMIPSLQDIELPDTELDPDTGFFVHKNKQHNFNIYLVSESLMSQQVEKDYQVINDRPAMDSPGLEITSGVIIENSDNIIKDLLAQIGFVANDTGDFYTRLVCPTSKFTIMIDKNNNSGIKSYIMDTHDVFKATANYTLRDIKLLDIEHDHENLELFGKLQHKIVGYNIKAWGNEESYSLENVIPGNKSLPTNIIFRQRKQYLKVNEQTINYYDNRLQTEK
jgi:hypothetical protein